jgi:rhodanese-related sulfurtransferase
MIDQITPSDFAPWLAHMAQAHPLKGAMLLDVREPHELQWASVASSNAHGGYQFLSIPMGAVPSRLAELDPDQPIACLCHHGVRSMEVARFLSNRGFSEVVNIAGGIDAWSVQLDPSVARY